MFHSFLINTDAGAIMEKRTTGSFFNIPHSFSICRFIILHPSPGTWHEKVRIPLMRCDREVTFVKLSAQNKCSLFVASHFP